MGPHTPHIERWRWHLAGQVQGVGFRPFVYRLAREHHLRGFVRNTAGGVAIEAEGPAEALARFGEELTRRRPPLAVLQQVTVAPVEARGDETTFEIRPSTEQELPGADVAVDTAVCPSCLAELRDRENRRHGYALINCTECGPRYSIVRAIPYDRPNTTMAGFPMCPPCCAEYGDPGDRRFHAQPTACPDCGPGVRLVDGGGAAAPGPPIEAAARLLREGRVVAIKGLGGFHLAVRADDAAAVARLRQLKKRDHKPFAVMAASIEAARRLVRLSSAGVELLQSPQCPIVLAPRLVELPGVAAGTHRLGVMLPYTPMQHLLVAAMGPEVSALVMTSGNQADEPLVIDNAEAREKLGRAGLCDAVLEHDRPIARCVDDSVVLDMGDDPEGPLPIRRSRGYAPASLPLPMAAGAPGLCVGGELKNTVAVVRGDRVILSQHVGDLTHPLAFDYFRRAIEDLCALFEVQPRWIAHDLHPLYLSTQHARALAAAWGVPLIGVQHHHAHAAAVMAEHGVTEPVLALVCDGTGYGLGGTIWGGELLLATPREFRRLAHVQSLRLPGGDAAARDTRRCALALLHQVLGGDFAEHPLAVRLAPAPAERRMLAGMITRDFQCAASSGLGRYFDGVAAILGLCDRNQFEAQAAMALEAAASARPEPAAARGLFALAGADPVVLDPRPMIAAIMEGVRTGTPTEELAALFHDEMAAAWDAVAARAAAETRLGTVALSGGVFGNERLTRGLAQRLRRRGLRVLRHRLAPPNDGGLALGQALVAAASSARS